MGSRTLRLEGTIHQLRREIVTKVKSWQRWRSLSKAKEYNDLLRVRLKHLEDIVKEKDEQMDRLGGSSNGMAETCALGCFRIKNCHGDANSGDYGIQAWGGSRTQQSDSLEVSKCRTWGAQSL